MNSPVPCQCGKRFKSQSAIAQHVRDSPRHGPSTASAPSNAGPGPATASPTQLPPPPQDNIVGTGKMTCACGKVVKGASGLHDHMRDSPRHAAAKNNASKKPSTSTSSATLAKSTPKRSTPPKSAVSTPHPPATPAPTEKTSNAVKNSKKEKKAAKEKGQPSLPCQRRRRSLRARQPLCFLVLLEKGL
ncbi:hypothetical protein B0T17DRAFT_620772 [Bombardia bombarda]|uniref:Uncharacterized protein n=1 Tax=Bombardia bombarda TaxID=252184 RepID=A0AA39T2D1_9PEZI|nr:hypothetical protein B0T17DRAFT_620772 [Bombardia bombarda]